jgi:hypothetical protein
LRGYPYPDGLGSFNSSPPMPVVQEFFSKFQTQEWRRIYRPA